MTTTVSISEFRNNFATYLDFLENGNDVSITDNKRNRKRMTLTVKKDDGFDKKEYLQFVKNLAGSGLLADKADEAARKKFRENINKRFDIARVR